MSHEDKSRKSALHAVKVFELFVLNVCKMWIVSFWHIFHIISGDRIFERTGPTSNNIGGQRTYPSGSQLGAYLHRDLSDPYLINGMYCNDGKLDCQ